ncbi:MAG: TIGR03915 family putative DNA repair protein [Sulfurospirillum sp.]|nr:TIGR03915 family putative DNA repair protein [Sulfurospirillum sp.]
MRIVYDGSFEGFLCVVYAVYYKKIRIQEIFTHSSFSLLSFDAYEIQTDTIQAKKVLNTLHARFEKTHYERITHIFLCDSVHVEKELLEYIILGFKDQKYLENITIPSIFRLHELQKEFFRLVHKMYGFVRFVELEDGNLYAKIETKFNVLPFLGKHFCKRLASNNFIIHDIKRKLAFVKSEKSTQMRVVQSFEEPTHSSDEAHFSNLWKVFFQSVAIKERENKKLQQNFVPLLYRKYMSEFS